MILIAIPLIVIGAVALSRYFKNRAKSMREYKSHDMSRDMLMREANRLLGNAGGPQSASIYFIFTCEKCGARIRLSEPNVLYEEGKCARCGNIAPITKGAFVLIGDKAQLMMSDKRQPQATMARDFRDKERTCIKCNTRVNGNMLECP